MRWGHFFSWFLIIGVICTIIAASASNPNWLWGWLVSAGLGLFFGTAIKKKPPSGDSNW